MLIFLLSCVINYGDPVDTVIAEPIAAPVSYGEIEARIDQLLVGMEDIDRVERLQAARDLAQHMKSQDPRAQQLVLDYLTVLVESEERANPIDVWVESGASTEMVIALPPIEEEALVSEEVLAVEPASAPPPEEVEGGGLARIAPQPSLDTQAMLASARSLLGAGDPYAAMGALEPCLGESCWVEVAGMWAHARDLFVYQRREEAAELFLRARAEPNHELRQMQLREVEEMLYKLLAQYPNTRYAPAIQRNVSLVQQELALLESD